MINMKDSEEVLRILEEMKGYDYGFPAYEERWALDFAIEVIKTHKEEMKNKPYIVG